jgi:hypothetical protein
MPELSEPDERAIRQYVNSQSPDDDPVKLVQKVGSRRVLGHRHEMYDVHCEQTRWWVFTNPTNLYQQSDFPQMEQALIFHIGLGAVLADRSQGEMADPEEEEQVAASWRRYRQAIDAMNDAHESEDFQAVGVKCRDALISLAKDHADDDWVGEVEDPPQAANFKGWANIFADRLTEAGRLRAFLKGQVDKTWDLTVWLQHNSNATPIDADIVLDATGLLLRTFAKLIRRQEYGEPNRCPKCESYRVAESVEADDDREGLWNWDECASCGWSTEPVFTSWQDHFEGTNLPEYLASEGTGISDRLHQPQHSLTDGGETTEHP